MNVHSIGRLPARIASLMAIATIVISCGAPAATPTVAPAAPAKPALAATNTAVPAPTNTMMPAAPTTAPVMATSAPTAAPKPTSAPAMATTTPPSGGAASPTAAASTGAPIIKVATDPKLGSILVDDKGMTLYLYTKDEPNVTNCYDQCAVNWPPLIAKDGQSLQAASGVTGKLATTTRKDGSKQVTYNGMPLYYWIKDTKVGDTTGQDVGSVWFVIPPGETGFPTVKVTKDAKMGNIMTDLKGMTLYKYTKDEGSTSTCYDQCAVNWPPLIVKDGDPTTYGGFPGKLGATVRKDGAKQVTLDGVPLYYYIKDAKAGDTTGQAVGSVWYVIEVK